MRVRKLAPGGDYSFGNGQADFYQNVPAAPGQVALTSCTLWQGEWFLDTDAGTPYMEGILGKHSVTDANNTFSQVIQGAQGVTGISKIVASIDPNRRVYAGVFYIDTLYGSTTVDLSNQTLF